MTKAEAEARIKKLRQSINEYRYAYHVLDKSEISDAALDSLKHELYTLEQQYPDLITADSPTQRVAGKPLAKFHKVHHKEPMLSIEDVFTPEEFEAWHARTAKLMNTKVFQMFCMVKLDGLAMELVYVDGLLSTGATRGDGVTGEDVTANLKTIEAIPLSVTLPKGYQNGKTIIVRGEVYFPIKEFEKLNKKLAKEGKETIVNPRNGAAGSVRQLDPTITAGRKLSFYAWDLVSDHGQKTQAEEWKMMREMGFPVNPESELVSSVAEVEAFWKRTLQKRKKLNYWIDGTVIRVNDDEAYGRLGVVGKTPRGLIAWKFPAEETTTVVENVEWFVGRTGALTPVAVVRPTFVAGTTVTHASLHNADEIERLDVRIGDTVILYKAGDIIPKVKEVLVKLRPKNAKVIHPPTHCPVCGSPVERRKEEVAIFCTNPKCFAQDRERLLHAARAFGIDGIGPSTVALLLDNKVVQHAPDLFTMKVEDLMGLERFAEISSKKLVDEIQAKKSITLDRFLVGLNIRHVGEETGLLLARHFGTIDKLIEASAEELAAVQGVGEVVGKSVAEFLHDAANQRTIHDYQKNGVHILSAKKATTGPLTGKTFVLTGTLSTLEREAAKEEIRTLGGDASETVSKKTFAVVVGENPGSKLEKAKKLGVKTLTEKEFLHIIRE